MGMGMGMNGGRAERGSDTKCVLGPVVVASSSPHPNCPIIQVSRFPLARILYLYRKHDVQLGFATT